MTTMLSGRPGPVNLDVPFNVFQEEDDVEVPRTAPALNARRSGASPDEISACVDLINKAKRPVIFIGHGVTLSEASKELTEFAHRLQIPVISSPNGMGCLDMSDPLSLGFIGRNGAYPANEAGRHADLVIAIGARFDDRSASSWMPGYSWNFPATQAHPRRRRYRRAWPQLSARHRNSCRCTYVPAAVACRGRTSRRQARCDQGMDCEYQGLADGVGKIHPAEFRRSRLSHPPRAHCRRLSGGDAAGRDPLLRRWRQPQLVHAILEARTSPANAQFLGLFRHGLWRLRRARRQARGAGPAGRRGHRRRMLHHGTARALHGGRIQHSGGMGDLEQFRLGLHP